MLLVKIKIMNRRLKLIFQILRYLPQNLYINFHYLPFKQAWKIPIMVWKPKFRRLQGEIQILGGGGKTGMIRLGFNHVSIYPNNGILLELRGKIVFHGRCAIGNNSCISTGKESFLEFGDNFNNYTSLKLVNYDHIKFGDNVLIGWNCLICDKDFHKLTRNGQVVERDTAPIKIGSNNWIANNCMILKNTRTNPNTVIAAGTFLSKDCTKYPEMCVIGNDKQVRVLSQDTYLNQ